MRLSAIEVLQHPPFGSSGCPTFNDRTIEVGTVPRGSETTGTVAPVALQIRLALARTISPDVLIALGCHFPGERHAISDRLCPEIVPHSVCRHCVKTQQATQLSCSGGAADRGSVILDG